MFSEAYKELCIDNADRLREEWEPETGDWCWDGIARHLVTGAQKTGDVVEITFMTSPWARWFSPRKYIPLFQPGQLIEMLEERGYALAHLGDERVYPDFEGRDWNPEEPYIALAEREPGDYVKGTGPDPAMALLRAWLEVVSHRGKEE